MLHLNKHKHSKFSNKSQILLYVHTILNKILLELLFWYQHQQQAAFKEVICQMFHKTSIM